MYVLAHRWKMDQTETNGHHLGHLLGTVDLDTEAVITWDTSAVTGCDFGLYPVRADVNSHQDQRQDLYSPLVRNFFGLVYILGTVSKPQNYLTFEVR